MIFGEKLLKKAFSFLQFTKKAQKAILWSRIHFFVKFVIFAGKLLSFRILHLACPKHVGTPCIMDGNYLKSLIFITQLLL